MGSVSLFIFFVTLLVLARQVSLFLSEIFCFNTAIIRALCYWGVHLKSCAELFVVRSTDPHVAIQRNSAPQNENLLKMYSSSGHPRCRWVCFFIRTDLEKFSITSIAHQWIHCNEWVPSEWESKQQIFISKDWSVDYLWVIVMFLSAVWTLILTAPIHCRGFIGEQVM